MGKFEKNWEEVFKEAEISPSDTVWANIDRDLANADGKVMKKKVLLYQRLAAASIFFALLGGIYGVYKWNDADSNLTFQKTSKDTLSERSSGRSDQNLLRSKSTGEIPHALNESDRAQKNESSSTAATTLSGTKGQNNLEVLNSVKGDSTGKDEKTAFIKNQQLQDQGERRSKDEPAIYYLHDKKLFYREDSEIPRLELLPVAEVQGQPVIEELVRKLPAISGAFMKLKQDRVVHERLWASVTADRGSYNSRVNPYSYSNYSAGMVAASSNSLAMNGSSYSLGVLVGARVTQWLVIQSGIQYLNQSLGSASNINPSSSLSSVANYAANPSVNTYATVSPYNIVSANEFVSVPLLMGYLFLDKKVGLLLNSGVATDIFIRNTLTDPSGRLQSYSQSAGRNSPYRSVNFSGLINSEVSYKLSNRYRVSLVPGFRYAFNPVLKSGTNSSSNPWLWDVGVRFRYILK